MPERVCFCRVVCRSGLERQSCPDGHHDSHSLTLTGSFVKDFESVVLFWTPGSSRKRERATDQRMPFRGATRQLPDTFKHDRELDRGAAGFLVSGLVPNLT